MKKTLIALAAFAAVSSFAQSSVSVYGAIDASFNSASSEGVSKTFMGTSQLGSSKLGFSGTEDLGNGLKANFKLEGGLNNDSGAGKSTNTSNQVSGGVSGAGPTAQASSGGFVFQRFAYVGLSGGFGEVRLGRDYVSAFLNVQAAVDPFGTNGPADSTAMALKLGGSTITNASNMIGYTSPDISGFKVGVQYFMGENVSGKANSDDGTGTSIYAAYAKGPLFLTAGQQTTKGKAVAAVAATSIANTTSGVVTDTAAASALPGDYTLSALSASYDLGVAKLAYTYAKEEAVGTAATAKNTSNLFGVTVPMGAFNLKASYVAAARNTGVAGVADETGTLFGLGVDYALSKRTTAYSTWARVTNGDNGASYSTGGVGATTANNSSQNLAIGIKHNF
jgi:predicted porin